MFYKKNFRRQCHWTWKCRNYHKHGKTNNE